VENISAVERGKIRQRERKVTAMEMKRARSRTKRMVEIMSGEISAVSDVL